MRHLNKIITKVQPKTDFVLWNPALGWIMSKNISKINWPNTWDLDINIDLSFKEKELNQQRGPKPLPKAKWKQNRAFRTEPDCLNHRGLMENSFQESGCLFEDSWTSQRPLARKPPVRGLVVLEGSLRNEQSSLRFYKLSLARHTYLSAGLQETQERRQKRGREETERKTVI